MKQVKGSTRDAVLRRYSRAIVHMRQQMTEGRFGLVFGAGASKQIGFPDWEELVRRIAEDERVGGEDLLSQATSSTSRSQLLFQWFRSRRLGKAGAERHKFDRFNCEVQAEWQRIVHTALYAKAPKDVATLLETDRYLQAFLPVLRNTRITINYNFDDSLQRMLSERREEGERSRTRGYSTVWSPDIQMYQKSAVIYHPNGFLPHDLREKPSENLVFLEDTFADQLIQSMHGHYASLAYHLAQSTRLFIGVSLNDATLRHLLRQTAQIYPGHFHYYVAYAKEGNRHDSEYERSVADANFHTYNLLTLFLNDDDIAALGDLISMNDDEFEERLEEVGRPATYRYMVTGAVCVGKSTTVSQFRSLRTIDEWLDERAPGMDKDPVKVDSTDIERIDNWVAEQVGKKNLNLRRATSGIYMVDRAPLDAFAFTVPESWKSKAKLLRKGVSPGKARRRLCDVHLILLIGDPEVLAVRAISRHKDMSCDYLTRQQQLLRKVYENRGEGVTVIDTRGKNVAQVTREVAEVVYRTEPYVEAKLHDWLVAFEKRGYDA